MRPDPLPHLDLLQAPINQAPDQQVLLADKDSDLAARRVPAERLEVDLLSVASAIANETVVGVVAKLPVSTNQLVEEPLESIVIAGPGGGARCG